MLHNQSNVTILDIHFTNTTMHQFLENVVKPSYEANKKHFIVTANPEIIMRARDDKAYKQTLMEADDVVPDGIGVIYAAKFKKQPLQERIAGFDLMEQMLLLADNQAASCYFLGATEEVNAEAVQEIQALYPNIQTAGRHHGYIDIEDDEVVQEIEKAQPDFVFVALGYPKQEMWIHQHLPRFSKGIFMGIGGCLDVYAGNVKRAPQIWINLHMEWLYRIVKQPARWKRMLPLVSFMWLAFWKKI